MDIPQNPAAANSRTDLSATNWTYEVWPTNFYDLTNFQTEAIASLTTGLWPKGVPGVTIDSRNTADSPEGTPDATRPNYSNLQPTDPVSGGLGNGVQDNNGLPVPTSPGIFIGAGSLDSPGELFNFVRIFASDIAPDPADDANRRGAWFHRYYGQFNCSNTSYVWLLCSPVYDEGVIYNDAVHSNATS